MPHFLGKRSLRQKAFKYYQPPKQFIFATYTALPCPSFQSQTQPIRLPVQHELHHPILASYVQNGHLYFVVWGITCCSDFLSRESWGWWQLHGYSKAKFSANNNTHHIFIGIPCPVVCPSTALRYCIENIEFHTNKDFSSAGAIWLLKMFGRKCLKVYGKPPANVEEQTATTYNNAM